MKNKTERYVIRAMEFILLTLSIAIVTARVWNGNLSAITQLLKDSYVILIIPFFLQFVWTYMSGLMVFGRYKQYAHITTGILAFLTFVLTIIIWDQQKLILPLIQSLKYFLYIGIPVLYFTLLAALTEYLQENTPEGSKA